MAIVQRRTQQPREKLDYAFKYINLLSGGDTLTKVSVVSIEPEGLIVDPPWIDGDQIKFLVSGGVANEVYKVTFSVLTQGGLVKEDEVIFRIKEQ